MRREDLPSDGRELFTAWLHEAEQREGLSARVMVVATSTPQDGATARSVICHKMNEDGGIVFGTNSASQKAQALACDPRCELLFRWGDRQIRVRGRAVIAGDDGLDGEESPTAFARLPRHCQLGLHCLCQGKQISEEEHKASVAAYNEQVVKFGLNPRSGLPIPCPANYTAIVVKPDTFEFYQGGQLGYINDRFLFSRSPSGSFPLLTRLQA